MQLPTISRWPQQKATLWQKAPFLRLLLPLVVGITCYDVGLPAGHYLPFIAGILLIACIGILICSAIKDRRPFLDIAFALLLPLAMTAIGWCSYALSDTRNNSDWLGHYGDSSGAQMVRVAEGPIARAKTNKYVVDILAKAADQSLASRSGKALLYVYNSSGSNTYKEGDTLLLPTQWERIHNSGNPFEFDNETCQRRKGIYHQQFIAPDKVYLVSSGQGKKGLLSSLHQWCDQQLQAYVKDSATLGLLQAMLLGDEQSFDPELRQSYSQTGVIHIVSISGSHVAVLFLVITGLLFWIRGSRGNWIKYGIGVAIVWIYVLMAGAPPSALRSAIMFTIIALSITSANTGQTLNTLLAAAFILLLAQPAWLFAVGFQLSFGAVLSMLLFYQPIYKLWPQHYWLARKVWQAVSASIAAELLTAPLVIYYFHNFPLFFIIANLLSAILIGICALVGGMCIIAFSPLPLVAGAVAWIVVELVSIFNSAINWLQHLNPPSFQYLRISPFDLISIYLIIAGLALFFLQRLKQGLIAGLAAGCALMISLNYSEYTSLRQQRLVVYNSGRTAMVEIIMGKQYHPLTPSDTESYTSKAAHTGWGAWRTGGALPQCYVDGSGRRLLLITDSTVGKSNTPFEADMVVMCRPLRGVKATDILETFHPKEVILASKPSDYLLNTWQDACRQAGVGLHNVSRDGAYILQ